MDIISSIQTWFEDQLQQAITYNEPKGLYDPLKYTLTLGGKRMRPLMVLMSYGVFKDDYKKAKQAALAVEMLHNFTLIHDDIMDKADKRRGKECVHIKWNENTAILSGDALFALSIEQLNVYGFDESVSKSTYAKLHKCFMDAVRIVCEGQEEDMMLPSQEVVTKADYLGMISKKTAALLATSLKLGAILAEQDEQSCNNLYNIGMYAGLAFQIQDDILDVVGNPEKVGKRRGGDIYEKKHTLLYLTALEKANEKDREYLEMLYLPETWLTEENVDSVIQIFNNLGIFQISKDIIASYYAKADEALHQLPKNVYSQAMIALFKSLLVREY